ncbi:hypothetical protein PAXINDRAFT_97443 [Paxillus involutus ATCC 200175]|nr:hypothetical protein PAXINDRAFT_97443 [Paxillus involutus ATCC 200175]
MGALSRCFSLFFLLVAFVCLCIQPLGPGQVVYFSRITSFDISMDSGRLPACRSSYLLRFHPYPRVKPSAREMIMAASQENEAQPAPTQVSTPHYSECNASFSLNQAIHGNSAHDEVHSRHRRLSISSLVIDLALLLHKTSLEDA